MMVRRASVFCLAGLSLALAGCGGSSDEGLDEQGFASVNNNWYLNPQAAPANDQNTGTTGGTTTNPGASADNGSTPPPQNTGTTGNQGGTGTNSDLDDDTATILNIVSHSAANHNASFNQGAQRPAGSVALSGVIKQSYTRGEAPSYMPFTITLTFLNETLSGFTGSAILNGVETFTVNADDSVVGKLRMVSTYTDATAADGTSIDGTMTDEGSFSGTTASVVVTMSTISTNFTIDGRSHRIRLTTRLTAAQQGPSFGTTSGTIDGKAVSYSF